MGVDHVDLGCHAYDAVLRESDAYVCVRERECGGGRAGGRCGGVGSGLFDKGEWRQRSKRRRRRRSGRSRRRRRRKRMEAAARRCRRTASVSLHALTHSFYHTHTHTHVRTHTYIHTYYTRHISIHRLAIRTDRAPAQPPAYSARAACAAQTPPSRRVQTSWEYTARAPPPPSPIHHHRRRHYPRGAIRAHSPAPY